MHEIVLLIMSFVGAEIGSIISARHERRLRSSVRYGRYRSLFVVVASMILGIILTAFLSNYLTDTKIYISVTEPGLFFWHLTNATWGAVLLFSFINVLVSGLLAFTVGWVMYRESARAA